MEAMNLSILLVEDNPVIADRFAKILDSWPAVTGIKVSVDVEESIDLIQSNKFDLLICDLNLPDGSGVEVMQALTEYQPDAIALVISALSRRELVMEAIRAGAIGYILKDDDQLSVIDICKKALEGESPLSPSIARMMIESVRKSEFLPESTATDKKPSNPLTPREIEVLSAISRGYSNKEVAKHYGMSVSTVPVHVRNIYEKLRVNNRSQATYEARRRGLLSD